MTASATARRMTFADPGEAAGLAAFLQRLLRWEKNASVRLKAADGVVGVFAKPARFDVLAVRTARLLRPAEWDSTVSAGELLESIDERREQFTVPPMVTGPPWAGVLPPRGGWERRGELPSDSVRTVAVAAVGEFRQRAEKLRRQDRQTLDALAEEIWSRPLGQTGMPLRVVHAAHALGFLRSEQPLGLLATAGWLRLRTPHGSVAVRTGGASTLPVSPA